MKISVITASYNYSQYIAQAIDSVINQSYENWELIIVDDASSDNSVEIIKSFCEKDSRIKLVKQTQNKGLKEAILLGISHASGDWVAFLESDDIFLLDNLLKKVETVEKYPDVKLIFNKVEFLTEEKRKQQKTYENTQKRLSKMTFPRNMFYDFGVDNPILTFSCVMVQKTALLEADFNTPQDTTLDRWLWIHLAQNNDFYYIDEKLTTWRLHTESYIVKSKKVFNFPQISAYLDIYKKDKKPFCLRLFILYTVILSVLVKVVRKIAS